MAPIPETGNRKKKWVWKEADQFSYRKDELEMPVNLKSIQQVPDSSGDRRKCVQRKGSKTVHRNSPNSKEISRGKEAKKRKQRKYSKKEKGNKERVIPEKETQKSFKIQTAIKHC